MPKILCFFPHSDMMPYRDCILHDGSNRHSELEGLFSFSRSKLFENLREFFYENGEILFFFQSMQIIVFQEPVIMSGYNGGKGGREAFKLPNK